VVIKIYRKESVITPFRILLPPVLLIVAQYITYQIQDPKNKERNRINPFILFFIFILIKLPFTLNQYDLIENVHLFERMMITGIEAEILVFFGFFFEGVSDIKSTSTRHRRRKSVSATLIAEGIFAIFDKI
jgi:hypothetical protein